MSAENITGNPIHIEIKGQQAAGKTMLLYDLMLYLSKKGLDVRGFDEFGEVPLNKCKELHQQYDPEKVYITTSLEKVKTGRITGPLKGIKR